MIVIQILFVNLVLPLYSRKLLELLRLRRQPTAAVAGLPHNSPYTQEVVVVVVVLILVHVMIVETGEWVLVVVGTLTLRVVVAHVKLGINLAMDTFNPLVLKVPLDVLSLFIVLRLVIIIAALQHFNLFIDSVNSGLSICRLLIIQILKLLRLIGILLSLLINFKA